MVRMNSTLLIVFCLHHTHLGLCCCYAVAPFRCDEGPPSLTLWSKVSIRDLLHHMQETQWAQRNQAKPTILKPPLSVFLPTPLRPRPIASRNMKTERSKKDGHDQIAYTCTNNDSIVSHMLSFQDRLAQKAQHKGAGGRWARSHCLTQHPNDEKKRRSLFRKVPTQKEKGVFDR